MPVEYGSLPEDLEIDPWDRFVLRHQRPGNLVIHFVSMLCFYGGPALALLAWNPWWLAAFFASGLLGAFGHWAFDDGPVSLREMTSQPEVPGFVVRMFWRMLRGEYARDTRLAYGRVQLALASSRAEQRLRPAVLPAYAA